MALEIKTKVESSDEGTSYYRKFLVKDGVIIGEVTPSNFNNLRYREIFND